MGLFFHHAGEEYQDLIVLATILTEMCQVMLTLHEQMDIYLKIVHLKIHYFLSLIHI